MTLQSKQLYGLILAGGRSRRMGQDKALLAYHGKSQLDYAYQLLQKFCAQVFVSAREDQHKQEGYVHLPQVQDLPEFQDTGPLGGICSAMKLYPEVSWVVLACDLPYIDQQAIDVLVANRDANSIATAFISTHDGLPEPLCAIWEAQAMAVLQEFLRKGIKCPRNILMNSKPKLIQQNNLKWLENINSPDEFQSLDFPKESS